MADRTLDGNPPAAAFTGAEKIALIQSNADVTGDLNGVVTLVNTNAQLDSTEQVTGLQTAIENKADVDFSNITGKGIARANIGLPSDAIVHIGASNLVLQNPMPTFVQWQNTEPDGSCKLPPLDESNSPAPGRVLWFFNNTDNQVSLITADGLSTQLIDPRTEVKCTVAPFSESGWEYSVFVSKVNGQVGANIVLDTDDIEEGNNNFYYRLVPDLASLAELPLDNIAYRLILVTLPVSDGPSYLYYYNPYNDYPADGFNIIMPSSAPEAGRFVRAATLSDTMLRGVLNITGSLAIRGNHNNLYIKNTNAFGSTVALTLPQESTAALPPNFSFFINNASVQNLPFYAGQVILAKEGSDIIRGPTWLYSDESAFVYLTSQVDGVRTWDVCKLNNAFYNDIILNLKGNFDANGATYTSFQTAVNKNQSRVLVLPQGVDTYVWDRFMMPRDWDPTTGLFLNLQFITPGTSGTAAFRIKAVCRRAGSPEDISFGTEFLVTSEINQAANTIYVLSINNLFPGNSPQKGDSLEIQIYRNGSNAIDTLAAPVYLTPTSALQYKSNGRINGTA